VKFQKENFKMTASPGLFLLVKSLTKSEKRYINLKLLDGKKNKNYIKLFNEILKQLANEGYNEDIIKEKFKNEKFIKQLTFTKNYLYNVIIKLLVDFHSYDNLEVKLYNYISSAKILFKKSLFDEYFKHLELAKAIAEKIENFGALIEIIKMQIRIVKLKDIQKFKRRDLYLEEKNVIKKIENISAYSKLLHSFYKITKIPDFARSKILYKEVSKIFEAKILSDINYALSITAKDRFYILLQYKYELEGDTKALFDIAKKRYALHRENECVFKNDFEDKSLSIYYQNLHYAIINGDKKYYETFLTEFIKKFHINIHTDKITDERKFYYFQLKMEFYYHFGQLSKAVSIASMLYAHLKATESLQNKDELFSFYYLYAKMLFENSNYEESLIIINNIFAHKYNKVRYDILTYSYLLGIFIHIELNNNQVAKSLIKTISRKISKHKEKELSEKIILKFFHDLCSEKNNEKSFIWKNFLKRVNTLKNNHFEQPFFNEFPIDKWLSKKSLDK
jgi:hypothetical protein